jgi:hypothetical protein
MIRQCFLANTGIQFYRETFKHIGLDHTTLFPSVTTRLLALEAPCVDEVRDEVKASTHCPDGRDDSAHDNQVLASRMAACTFKSEEHEELLDALSPIHDRLVERKAWWILEILPPLQFEWDREKFSRTFVWRYVFISPIPSLCHSRGRDFSI